ncbi:EamA family transporter [Saccharopolyspora sp. NPDC050642]|uniref:EamA family transporter n=1 Tax=Saccharopolyspora sp. NPDC050642 TaxID=3157099 RepID=UPI0033DF530E
MLPPAEPSRRRAQQHGSPLALAVACAAVIALPFGIAESGTALLSPAVLLAGLGIAVLSAVVPYSLEMAALRRIPPRVVGVLQSLEPAAGAAAGLLLLAELLTPSQVVALGCVTAASIGAVLTRAR